MSLCTTLIENLTINTPQPKYLKTETEPITTQFNLCEVILDLSIDLDDRLKSIELFYLKFGQEQTLEIVNRLSTMYQFSGTKILEKYLCDICFNTNISSFLKITIAKSICYFDLNKEIGFKVLDHVCKHAGKTVATPCQIEAVCLLMTHQNYQIQSRDYFCSIINDEQIDCDYRYKTILSLENKNIDNYMFFLSEAALEFFYKHTNWTLYRILAGQLLIQKCKIQKSETIENILISFSQDPDLDYNLRADAADVILRLGSNENKITARTMIIMLGRQNGEVKTIFDNAQNVHINEIEESVLNALEFLSTIDMKNINYEHVKKQIDDLIKLHYSVDHKSIDKINISMNRIYLDRALYSKYNCTLIHILLKVWTYITTHVSENDMKKRLLEELVDMSGTCSSGFASRLVNTIAGFGDFNLRISYRDQIIANFNGRLNSRARDISKHDTNVNFYNINTPRTLEDFQDKVIEEMSINSNEYASKSNFLNFFRQNMLSIRQELYEEFKTHIDDPSFDLYFRSAIAAYETGGYV